MSRWQRKPIPPICERMIGFSVPRDDEILVVSYEGTHILHLGPVVTIETDEAFAEYDIYDPASGVARYRDRDYRIIGLKGGNPILDGPKGERLNLNVESERLSVVKNGEVIFSEKYENFSGDWAVATFSPDGKYIVLGCPYDFDFRLYERAD